MESGAHEYQDEPPRLVLVAGPRAGEEIEVTYMAVIGRSHADIIVNDPELSRQHASVRPVPGGLEFEDLGSLNGTWVNDERITSPTTARARAKVKFGATIAEVIAQEAPPSRKTTVRSPTRQPGE